MRYLLLILLFACGAAYSPPVVMPVTQPSAPIPVVKPPVIAPITPPDTTKLVTFIRARAYDIREFGAKVDGSTDDILADSTACAYCIANPSLCSEVIFPVGHSRISRTLKLANNGSYFTIHLTGMLSAKSSSNEYLSAIDYSGTSGAAISIQFGRSVQISNLAIAGKYTFPYTINNYNIGTTMFAAWNDGSVTDSRNNPYAGIVIDPDITANGGGTSDATIDHCSIKQFMVGICLSPNGVTQNDEMINILDDDIEADRVAIAVCQDQSKTIKIEGLKVWASTYTVLDGLSYGSGTGGGSVFCDNWNIAGNVNQLFYLRVDRFPLSASRIYSESLFRIGSVGSGAGANMNDCEIDFLMGAGMPAPDFLLFGKVNFHGGCLRYYDNNGYHRMNFVGSTKMGASKFSDITLNTPPITSGIYGASSNFYPTPIFDNVFQYSSYKQMQSSADTLFLVPLTIAVLVNKSAWTATATASGLGAIVNIGDYLLNGSNWSYYDTGLNNWPCPTVQVGRVTAISGDQVTLTDVGLTAYSGGQNLYISRLK